ncbi:uncharacterized protein TNCV_3422201 [Trichonephila clavipes]|nr:uncharacterized protein TNCV_3422201 [Trichonephila clavipes]
MITGRADREGSNELGLNGLSGLGAEILAEMLSRLGGCIPKDMVYNNSYYDPPKSVPWHQKKWHVKILDNCVVHIGGVTVCAGIRDEHNINKSLVTRTWKEPSIQREGCGSPVVKVSDHGMHVKSSSPVPLKIRRLGQRSTLNLSRAQTSSRWCQPRCRPRHLTMVQNDEVRRQKPSCS